MNSIRHLCQGGTAAERVRTVLGESVLEIRDDYAIGPLVDVDSSSPDARIAFWAELFAWDEEILSEMRTEFRDVNEVLANLGREATEVVIWAGSNPIEQAMRRRMHWWLQDAPVLITEVLVDTPVAVVSIEHLHSRFERRTPSTIEDRRRLAADWAALREKGHGVRIWEADCLSERPIDHYDTHLLSLVGTEPAKFLKVLGQAMAATGRTDSFCEWRFAALIQTGQMSLTHADMQDWRSATRPRVSISIRHRDSMVRSLST
ncbi:DUF1835 domain-containing protein [Pseudomonas sp. TH31]|uniref:DUF1835 domain-containing protein n=1 Tax=Pseudomonas sp. TH31 TaxID=2796396 RepID=UPI0019115B8A|nr:DUF1835 domain-containing protein [Pseudomonas sp. TH31]MBK5416219.1 DUF1835 domain-containing protein [Pseudomonas sp. TH31]